LPIGKGVVKRTGEKVAILNFGTLLPEAAQVADKLNATLVDMRFVKPLDDALILQLAADHDVLVTLEENAIMGGAGSGVNELLMAHRRAVPVLNIGLPDVLFPRERRKKCAPTSAWMPPVSKPKSPPGWHNPANGSCYA
jgi:1-deoxy-D-xylulose-5-phosphate synthase